MAERESGISLVLTTLPDEATAAQLARRLVDEQLIACGNVVPGLTSIYRWEGVTERAREVLLVMKTREELVQRLFERAARLHPYEVPELVALRATDVADTYARWLRDETIEVNG